MSNERVRVAALQYFMRPVKTFAEFRDQVEALIETAADYDCKLAVFPEYFSAQLLTLGEAKRPIAEQIQDLSYQVPAFVEMLSDLAKRNSIYVNAGSIPVRSEHSGVITNRSYLFGPSGEYGWQGKLHMTRFEREDWDVHKCKRLRLFQTDFGKLAIAICYDVEFPELARAAAHRGADILLVPSCTDDRLGYLRVRYCAHARAIENQMYVIIASTVGSIPTVPAVSLNYGQACILTPSDFPFARDGILAEGSENQESMVIGELNLETISHARTFGTVLPLRDSHETPAVIDEPEDIAI